jgi:alpha-1,6-mannosyltransferase
MRIVQVANFYGPRSGGLRTALDRLGAGYAGFGHEVVLVVPGARAGDEVPAAGVRRIVLRAPVVPLIGGYRVLDPWRVIRLLERVRPDVIEVSDRTTLRGLGRWARRAGVRSVVISHERADRLLAQFLLPGAAARRLADLANRRMAGDFDTVVCTTGFARQEFDRVGAGNVVRVPLGVDLDTFAPARRDPAVRRVLAQGADVLLVHCGRLSAEKHPHRSVDALAALCAAGVRARLVVAGDGPRRAALQRRAGRLPVTFLGFLAGRDAVAAVLASADVSVVPGPHETFGLAALEALACGTPVVVSRSSALPEIVRPGCGVAVADDGAAFAAGVRELLALPEGARRGRARATAQGYGWPASVTAMLAALTGAPVPVPRGTRAPTNPT